MALSQTLPGTQQTDLVTFTLNLNGSPASTQYQVASIVISKEVNKISWAKLMIYDGSASAQDFPVSNEATFIPGTEIEITAGYHSDEQSIFKGIILKHSLKIRNDRSPVLMLDCRDKAVAMTVARKNKYFSNSKDSDAVQTIVGTYQLDTDIEDTSVQLDAIVQYDCTDWDFIVSRMEANGKLCFVDAGKLTAKKPDFTAATVLDAVFGSTIFEFDADLDARNQYQGLKAKTWDYSNQAITSVDAAEPGFEENGNISSSDLGSVLSISEYDLYSGEDVTQPELQNLADGRLLKARMARLRGRVRIRGFGQVNPGDLINLGGVGDRFNGKVFVSGVRQEITNGVWNTDLQFGLTEEPFTKQPDVHSSPAANMLPAIKGLQAGVVTDLASDPNSQHRIRVRLPIIDESDDGVWSRIATLDAGDNRGTFFRPEIGDEVLVGFLNNDPRNPVVLGMMNSSAKPAPLTASNDNDEKGYVSRSGMKMIFNDKEKSLKIETPAGKKVTISEQDNVMSLEDEKGNKFTMDSQASSVTVESPGDISLKAKGDLKIEAVNVTISPSSGFSVSAGGSSIKADGSSATVSASSVTVQGSGTTAIKGGIVQIN
jgi:Rhs element Vgr protein